MRTVGKEEGKKAGLKFELGLLLVSRVETEAGLA